MVENERKDDNTGDSGGKSPKKLRVLLRTFGCQMNSRDSELVIGQFLGRGYGVTENVGEADVILFNTCSVRQHAEDRVWSGLGDLKKFKNIVRKPNTENRTPIIGIIGCMAKSLGKKIIERAPHVDLVCSPNDLAKICDYVEEIAQKRDRIVAVGEKKREKSFYKHLYHQDKRHCYVNISEGCSNFCSYCVVPYVRGAYRDRPYKEILADVKALVKDGVESITLLGQNVCAYGANISHLSPVTCHQLKNKRVNFIRLLGMISDIEGVKEIGFLTSHPKDVKLKLFDLMAQRQNIKKYLHLAVQSGSNRILKLMNRKYTREKYLKFVDEFRKRVPGGIVATDIIIGFPTETDEDFQETLDLIRKVRFNFAYIFKYSPRPHTKAAQMNDDVSKDVKDKRHKILLDAQREISKKP